MGGRDSPCWPSSWSCFDPARAMRRRRRLSRSVRAARTGRTQSDVLDEALRQGLGVVQRIRAKNEADEEEALRFASEAVHEVRAETSR